MPRSLLCFLFAAASLAAQSKENAFPPHRIAARLYYVGSDQYSSFLFATDQGHILINSSFESSVPLIRAAVEKLGFRFSDVKILLESHAHSDHVAGHALVKELTGARVLVMKGDDDLIASGGKDDFQYPARWKPCKVDHVLRDGEEVSLGGTTLVAHHTPGHTKGATTWTTTVQEGGRANDVVIHSSTSVNPGYILVDNPKYPGIAADYERSFRVFKSLKCDIFLAPHPVQYGMPEKYKRVASEGVKAFVDPEGYRRFVATQEKTFLQKLAEQRKPGQ